MRFFIIISVVIATCLACGVVEPASTRAVRDARHALGMVLVEREEQKLLKMVLCRAQGEILLEGMVLADEARCPNAFVDAEGNGYYFSDLQPQGVRASLYRRGYLKLGSLLLIPIAVGTVFGWKAKPLIKRLMKGTSIKETEFGVGTGLIAAIITHVHLRDHLWGKGERLTAAHWDDIFKLHYSFTDAKLLENPAAIKHILRTIASELDIKVNPALDLP